MRKRRNSFRRYKRQIDATTSPAGTTTRKARSASGRAPPFTPGCSEHSCVQPVADLLRGTGASSSLISATAADRRSSGSCPCFYSSDTTAIFSSSDPSDIPRMPRESPARIRRDALLSFCKRPLGKLLRAPLHRWSTTVAAGSYRWGISSVSAAQSLVVPADPTGDHPAGAAGSLRRRVRAARLLQRAPDRLRAEDAGATGGGDHTRVSINCRWPR